VIESRLDALQRRAPRPVWIALALLGAGAVAGAVMTRLPLLRLLGLSAHTLQLGIGVVTAVAAIRRGLALGNRRARATHRGGRPGSRLRPAA
jgi:hypothetical protein